MARCRHGSASTSNHTPTLVYPRLTNIGRRARGHRGPSGVLPGPATHSPASATQGRQTGPQQRPASWGAARPGHSLTRAHLAICPALSDGDSGPDTRDPEAAHQGPTCHLPTLMDGGADHSGGLRDRPAPAKAQSKPSHPYVTHGSGVPWQHAPNHAALPQHSPCHSTTPAFNRTQGIPATRPAPGECLGWAAISRPAQLYPCREIYVATFWSKTWRPFQCKDRIFISL